MTTTCSYEPIPAHSCYVTDAFPTTEPFQPDCELSTPAAITWLDQTTGVVEKTALATPALLNAQLYLAAPFRSPHRYPRQRNYLGYYYFSNTGQHVWHESLLEAAALRQLDFEQDIVAIAAQPMSIRFGDGTWHVPDYMALHANGTQVVYDVKPSSLMKDQVLEQFIKTRDVCKAVGWGYAICNELPLRESQNLKWISNFKHAGYHPTNMGATGISELLGALSEPITLGEAAQLIGAPSMAHGRSSIYHLVWIGILGIDLSQHVNDRALIKGGRHAHA